MEVRRGLRAGLWALLALAVACGGRSVRVDDRGGGDETGSGGASGRGGTTQGGDNTGALGGFPEGGVAGTSAGGFGAGGSVATGGVGIGGTIPMGGTSSGGSAGYGWDMCASPAQTTIVGNVYDPAGRTPLYNVIVYVPSGPPEPFAEGVHCESCPEINPPLLSGALSDTRGRFVLPAPSGKDVPVVVQIGRWRREVTVPLVRPCVDNFFDDPELFRLPRSQSEGHIPKIAVTTGPEDSLECLLRRIGIDDSEFTTDTDSGRVNLFAGCTSEFGSGTRRFSDALGGATLPPSTRLFSNAPILTRYDYVLLGCEGAPCENEKSPYSTNIQRYADLGGRLMLDHRQVYWIESSTAWQSAAQFAVMPGTLPELFTAKVDVTFPKGLAFSEWLVDIGASTSQGELDLHAASESVRVTNPPTLRWLYTDSSPADVNGFGAFQMLIKTPLDAPEGNQCGRVTFSDFHAYSPDGDESRFDVLFPDGCRSGPLSPQEAAFEFQLFDVSGCVMSDIGPPLPPR